MSENHEVRWKRLFFGMLAVLLLAILASSSAQAGFVRQDGKRYYYRTSGRKVKGWLKKGKRTYYLDPDQDGAVTVGYLKLGKKGYYFRKNGTLVKGAFATDPLGNTYCATKSGVLYRGLRKIGKRYYYFDRSSHAMQTGWVKTSKGTYYMKGAGRLRGTAVIGWLRKDGLRYYFNNAGRMVTGLVRIGGRQYYFDPQTGAMATVRNEWSQGEGTGDRAMEREGQSVNLHRYGLPRQHAGEGICLLGRPVWSNTGRDLPDHGSSALA